MGWTFSQVRPGFENERNLIVVLEVARLAVTDLLPVNECAVAAQVFDVSDGVRRVGVASAAADHAVPRAHA
jgi:hypothetical protein